MVRRDIKKYFKKPHKTNHNKNQDPFYREQNVVHSPEIMLILSGMESK